MTTREFGDTTLTEIEPYVWEIERTGGMRVPARVFASEALLEEIGDDMTLDQVQDAAHLPGVAAYTACLPDGHQGYGFPIGGVAGIDAEEGCISPGAVGYDINCLPADTDVRVSFGRRRPIADLCDEVGDERATVATGENGEVESIIRLLTESDPEPVYEVTTETGDTVRATSDHPFRTPAGMAELSDLTPGDTVTVSPFRGIEHEEPEEFVAVDEGDLDDANPQLVAFLKRNDLLPLRSTDDAFNRLLKLAGFHTGDGSFAAEQTWFYADPEDLEQIREDVAALGFTPSRIYEREREHEIGGNTFERTEYSVKVGARGFKRLLVELGVPTGRKVENEFTTPDCLDRLTDWQRALYLSAYFGAEMSVPANQHDKNLQCPTISQTRTRSVADAGEQFVREVADYLDQIGVETNTVERFDTDSGDDRERLRLGVQNDSQNLIRFFERVGYRYNESKQREAIAALQYLKKKERTVENRTEIASEVARLADGGTPVSDLKVQYDVTDRFVERSAWSGRKGRPRPPTDFPGYEEFREQLTVRDDRTVDATIESIEPAGEERVYDLGVEHEAHNFVADGFVVSNCGVRMLTTPLDYDDVHGREEDLVEALAEGIPAGLGGGGVVETDVATIDEILDRGMEWALDEGYATEADLAHCEDEGRRTDADPGAVSREAKERGAAQVGSLGSGNHFLEVQRVTDVYREDVADAFGLREDQVVVLIHCGSRGLGHQVCTNYLRKIEKRHPDLLAQLPEKELAAAPAGSELADAYYGAMCAATNFAWTNRQLIAHRVRETFTRLFDADPTRVELLYDVAHNVAKREEHEVPVDADGVACAEADAVGHEVKPLYVHRKGATRAFPAGRPELPGAYADVGQPVLVPGSMGAGSYVLRGGERSLELTFGSTAHGAGRLMSRTRAKREFWGEDVRDDLRDRQQIYVAAESGATIAEEAPGVYKDVDEVVRVSDALGIGDKVARTFPVCNVKG
jgi:tRNA-splicing ligase RtcB